MMNALLTTLANIPPSPGLTVKDGQPVWLGFLIMFCLLVVVMLVSLMPSKRSHQD
jgi:hypothetical protein